MITPSLNVPLVDFLELLLPTEEERQKFLKNIAQQLTGNLTEEEAARHLGVSVTTFRAQDIPYVVIGGRKTWDIEDLKTWRRKQPRQTGLLRARAIKPKTK